MADLRVAFWNLQNLFDTKASELATDLEFTPAEGWTEPVLAKKLKNLAEVIGLMHAGKGPDLVGICEVENKPIAERLLKATGRDDYKLAHVEAPDIRGIDASLIYSDKVFKLTAEPVGHLVHLRHPTRDIFEVPLKVKQTGAELLVIVNHWPSRRAGQYESEPFRITVAEHCGRIIDKHLKFQRGEYLKFPNSEATLKKLNERWNRNVLLMGDFNDEPYSRSMLEYLNASRGEDHLEELVKPTGGKKIPLAKDYLDRRAYLFNCMWRLLGDGDLGSHHYSASTNTMNMLDQFLVSRGLYYGEQGLKMKLDSVGVFTPAHMIDGAKKRPKAFDKKTQKGYSDHFPIQAVIQTV